MVLVNKRMRLTFLLLVLCVVHANTKRTKKITNDESNIEGKLKSHVKTPSKLATSHQKAIIAIEIVDPNDNSTKSGKGRKRTIESALGYGYQSNSGGYENFFNVKPKPPRYEVYKYSQHDIPPYKGPVKQIPVETYEPSYHGSQRPISHAGTQQTRGHAGHGQFEIQKSVQYDLGSTQPVYVPHGSKQNLQQYYQNGATLFSSLDQNGHLSSLSSHAPATHGQMVPVIIFRVYTNQLSNAGGLHPNIPNGHPYANLNNVDLQRLLSGYVQKHAPQQQQQQYYEEPASQQHYAEQQQQQQQVYYQQGPSAHQHIDHGLDTNENYPDDAHTKVIFHKSRPAGHQEHQKRRRPQKFKITIPENTFSKVEVQEHSYPAPNVQYAQQQYGTPEQYAPDSSAEAHNYEHAQGAPQPYYYQSQQDYQPSSQSAIHYQQTQPEAQHASQEPEAQYDAKQYIQVATYPGGQEQLEQQQPTQEYYQQQYVQYEQQVQSHQGSHPSQVQASQEIYEQTTNAGVQYVQHTAEQGGENQDYSLVKHSNDAGRDLHLKLYNYHAHTNHRGAQNKKRERKQRTPLVLSPEVMASLKSKH